MLTAAVIAVMLLAACSSSPDDEAAPAPVVDPPAAPAAEAQDPAEFAPDTLVQCGGSTAFPASALHETVPLEEANVPAEAFAPIEEFLATGEGDFWPQDGYRVLHQTDTTLLLVRVGEGGGTTFLGSELGAGGWQATELTSGQACPIRIPLPDGLHEVDWRVHPDQDLADDTTQVRLLATGQACSSGRPMEDRLQPPTVLFAEDAVFLSLAARLPGGAQNCQGNPEELVTINLDQPLDGREILDGRTAAGLITDYVPAS